MNAKERWAIKVRPATKVRWIFWTTHSTLGEARSALKEAQKKWFEAKIVKLVSL